VCERIPFLILPVKQLSGEQLGKTLGPSRPIHPLKRCERAIGQDAEPASNHPPKRRERAVRQDARPVSNRILHRSAASELSGKTPGPDRTIRRSDTRASHLASCRARLEPHAPPRELPRTPSRPPHDPSTKPLPWSRVRSGAQAAAGGRRRYRTELLRLFAVNPLMGGELGRIVMGGSYSYIIIEHQRRPRAPHLLRDYRET